MEQVGRRIAALRLKAGLTQAQVAKSIDTAVNNYQRIEHGAQNATIRTLVKIANVIGVPTAALFEPGAGDPVAQRGRPPTGGRPRG
jgi:transcriptional regulator with XRE-family HTH domain